VKRIATVGLAFSILLVLTASVARAEDKWTETKSTNFTAWSNASDRQAQDLLWQLLIAEARKADSNSGDAYAAEAQLLLREDKADEAKTAFVKAASLGSANANVYYRAATSMWGATRTEDATLKEMDAYLTRATELNPIHAASYAALAEVRAALKKPADEIDPLLTKAVSLDPSDPWTRLSATRTLWRLGKFDEARNVARIALVVAGDDARAKAEAERLLATIPEKK
jgi:Tfp pilus assembly protein PilF